MAEEVVPAQVAKELLRVDVAPLAELAHGVAAVRRVVGVALALVQRQLGPGVQPPLVGEDVEVLAAQVAEEELVLSPNVGVELLQGAEDHLVGRRADGAAVVQQAVEGLLAAAVGEADAISPLHAEGLVLHLLEADLVAGEDHLGQVAAADGALGLAAHGPQTSGALVADGVVAQPHREDAGKAEADRAVVLAALREYPGPGRGLGVRFGSSSTSSPRWSPLLLRSGSSLAPTRSSWSAVASSRLLLLSSASFSSAFGSHDGVVGEVVAEGEEDGEVRAGNVLAVEDGGRGKQTGSAGETRILAQKLSYCFKPDFRDVNGSLQGFLRRLRILCFYFPTY